MNDFIKKEISEEILEKFKDRLKEYANEPDLLMPLDKTCINLRADNPTLFECSKCGCYECDSCTLMNGHYNYCPNCGRKIITQKDDINTFKKFINKRFGEVK